MTTVTGTVQNTQQVEGTVNDPARVTAEVIAAIKGDKGDPGEGGGGLNGEFEDVSLSGRFNEILDLSETSDKVKLTISTNDTEIQYFGEGTDETKLLWIHFSAACDGVAIQCAPLGTDGIKYFGENDLARVVFKQAESNDFLFLINCLGGNQWTMSLIGAKSIDQIREAIPADDTKVDKVEGYSLVADTEIAKIHAPGSDNQDLSGYVVNVPGSSLVPNAIIDNLALLAIEVTSAELFGLISNSGLKPSQWYLITDFQNICKIADSQGTPDYSSGEVEQIYVKALSTSTLQREAVSKTFPDEIVEFNPTFSDVMADLQLEAIGNGTDVNNTYTEFTADIYGTSVDELQLGGTLIEKFADATVLNIYYYNGITGFSFHLFDIDKGTIWEYDDVNYIFKLLKTPYEYYEGYENGSSYGFFNISITDSTHFVLGCPSWMNFADQRSEGTYFYLSDGENGETYDYSQKGITWDYDAGTDTITILSGPVDLTNENLYMEFSGVSYCDNTIYNTVFSGNGLLDISADGSSVEFYSQYVNYSVKGKIEARRNLKFDFYCQADYRVQKVRRYKALCDNWSAGTYNPGSIVRYSSYIYVCLKQTIQTPSTTATNWFRLFGDSYNLASDISLNCSVQSISGYLSIDTANYTDMYICNDSMSDFDAGTEKLNTQILKHPYADQTKPLNVSFYNGFHGCKNANITAHETHFILHITNSNINFENGVVNSTINYSSIASANHCVLWQITYLNAIQLYQILSYDIDYTVGTFVNSSVFRNGITKSNFLSVSSCIFSAKPTDCNITNISITDVWGSTFSNIYINKMYNCTFNSSVIACEFNGDTYYANWYSNCYRNKFMANCYGSSNTARQTFYYMADNLFAQNVALNYFSTTGGNITNNNFLGVFSNNFSSATPSASTYDINANTFLGTVSYFSGSGIFSISNNIFGITGNLVFNNTNSKYARISENFIPGTFGNTSGPVIFNNPGADFNFRYNTCLGVFYNITFSQGNIEYNIFEGRVQYVRFGGTTPQAFTYNRVGNGFTGTSVSYKTIDANVTKCVFPNNWVNKAITSVMSDIIIMSTLEKMGLGIDFPTEKLDVVGNIKATGYKSSDGSEGITTQLLYLDDNSDQHTMHIKNGLIVGIDI